MLKTRRQKLAILFEQNDLDLLLFEQAELLRYFAGFSGSEGALLLDKDRGWLIVDSRYTVQAHQEVSGLEIIEQGQRLDAIASLVRAVGCRRLGFDAAYMTVQAHKRLAEHLEDTSLVSLGDELMRGRHVKDAFELSALADVASLASSSFEAIVSLIRPGAVEADLALQLEFEMRRRGADGRGFDFIVASGVRGAMPHGRASEKQIQAGELVTFDFGALKSGYHSDETVTVAVGTISQEQQKLYDTVLAAHDLALAAIRPGIACRDIDAVARNYIAEHGYGDFFGHGLGHGVGLDIHEKPVISPRSEAVAEEGMVFTVEPGIYIADFGGVRIEDTVAVTADGCRILTKVPKQLLRL